MDNRGLFSKESISEVHNRYYSDLDSADYTRLLESSGVIETSTPIVAYEPKDFAMSKEDIAALESVISRIDLVYVSGL